SPAPVVERAVAGWRRQAERWGVKLEEELGPGLASVQGDEPRVERLLRNLVGHAVKFSVQPGTVGIRASSEPGLVRFEVSFVPVDPGSGEPGEVFGRYYIARQGKTLKMSGVGFSFAGEVVSRLGGSLHAERRDGKQDRFVLTLPAKAAAGAAA